jgi:lipoprotein-anchoring transpeptidase ErfK/SrfK
MASAPITITFEDKTFTADKSEIGSWIAFSENGDQLTAKLAQNKVTTFANSVGAKVAINKVDREIMEGTGEVLVEGSDGRGVDINKLSGDLYNQVLSGSAGSIGLVTFVVPKGEVTKNPHAMPGRYEGRYIDVNLSEQTLYAFEGTKLVNQFLISSGISSHPTPTGEYHVYNKTRSQTMDGPGYSLPHVEWISWWSGDYSIHGTYWHNNFGHPMSHGCINASNGNAEWIYNWDEVGTPVYVHW